MRRRGNCGVETAGLVVEERYLGFCVVLVAGTEQQRSNQIGDGAKNAKGAVGGLMTSVLAIYRAKNWASVKDLATVLSI